MKSIFGLMIAVSPVAALAQQPVVITGSDEPTMRVAYSDLNLATADGAKTLHHRISQAVDTVCRVSVGPNPAISVRQRCLHYAWQGANPQMRLAVQRAEQLASTGQSSIPAAPISIAAR